jgi:hypothetical protein
VRRPVLAGSIGALGLALAAGAAGHPLDQERSTKTMSDDKADSLDKTVLRVGDADVTITRADLAAIADALRAFLKASDYVERDEVLVWSQGEGWIDPDGSARIGTWLLGAEGGELYLRYREPATELGAKAHRAVVEKKDGAWTVVKVELERIRLRS